MDDEVLEFKPMMGDALIYAVSFFPGDQQDSSQCSKVDPKEGFRKPGYIHGSIGDAGCQLDNVDDVFQQQKGGERNELCEGEVDEADDGSEKAKEHCEGDDGTCDEQIAEGRDDGKGLKIKQDDGESHDLCGCR